MLGSEVQHRSMLAKPWPTPCRNGTTIERERCLHLTRYTTALHPCSASKRARKDHSLPGWGCSPHAVGRCGALACAWRVLRSAVARLQLTRAVCTMGHVQAELSFTCTWRQHAVSSAPKQAALPEFAYPATSGLTAADSMEVRSGVMASAPELRCNNRTAAPPPAVRARMAARARYIFAIDRSVFKLQSRHSRSSNPGSVGGVASLLCARRSTPATPDDASRGNVR
jgi:hypothetical protein